MSTFDAVGERSVPGDLQTMALIARRGAIESLRDRTTLLMSLFFALAFPVALTLLIVRPLTERAGGSAEGLGTILAIYLLIIGLMPSTAAVGIAAGQFAGEKEQGSLTPLLASPASNRAIFGGKVLASIIPPILFAIVAEAVYLGTLALVAGVGALGLLPPALSLAMIALVPAFALLAAIIACLISSRVRTFNTAQQLSGIALLPLWFILTGLVAKLGDWGPFALLFAVMTLLAGDLLLLLLAAATWRREEVLAQR